jgi:hypothetical protein
LGYFQAMKTSRGTRTFTFGDLIGRGCRSLGTARATGFIRLAAKTQLIVFREDEPASTGREKGRPVPIQFI